MTNETNDMPDVIYFTGERTQAGNMICYDRKVIGSKFVRADLVPAAPVVSSEDAKRALDEINSWPPIKAPTDFMMTKFFANHLRTVTKLLTAAAKESE